MRLLLGLVPVVLLGCLLGCTADNTGEEEATTEMMPATEVFVEAVQAQHEFFSEVEEELKLEYEMAKKEYPLVARHLEIQEATTAVAAAILVKPAIGKYCQENTAVTAAGTLAWKVLCSGDVPDTMLICMKGFVRCLKTPGASHCEHHFTRCAGVQP